MTEPADQECQRSELLLSPIFKDLSGEVLDGLVSRGKTLTLKDGDPVLFQDVRGGHGLFVLLSGSIGVYRKFADASTQKIGTLKPGDCLGEYSLLDSQPMSATALALESTRLFFLPKTQFLAVTERDPKAGCTLYRNLAAYLVVRLRMYAEMHPKELLSCGTGSTQLT